MKKILDTSAVLIILIITFGITGRVIADNDAFGFPSRSSDNQPLAAATLIPTVSPSPLIDYPTPEARVLPPIGGNAGLVIGASVLVLIIIGGVLSSRLRSKH